MASAMLLLPLPFGPITAVTPGWNTNLVGSAKLLKPEMKLLEAGHVPASATSSSAASAARLRALTAAPRSRGQSLGSDDDGDREVLGSARPRDETSSYCGRVPWYRWLHS